MHFWIDKRSQSCSFGRTRAGLFFPHDRSVSTGYNFYHPPRRNRSKAMLPPVHRSFQAVDTRLHINRSNLHRSSGNRSHRHPEQQHHMTRQHGARAHTYGEPADFSMIQQYEQQIALEHGTLGLHALQPGQGVADDQNLSAIEAVDTINSNESQALPSHLKCGMWASLVLATIFLVAFQGSGLEILLFCAFSATFFVAACTVSLCRRPRNLNFSHSQLNTITTNISNIEHIEQMDQQEIHVNNPITDQISAPPPPYHIAILTANNKQVDDSLPPPYEKVVN